MISILNKPKNYMINRLLFCIHRLKYPKDIKIRGIIYIHGKHISFGHNCIINSGLRYNPIGGQTRAMLVAHGDGKIIIGNNVGMSNCALVAKQLIEIQDDVMIGGSCKIYDTDFHALNFAQRMENPDTHIKSAPVLIKRGAFIGAHSIILKGATIGERAIIGAGSVVTKDVPDGEIWAGNPARFIRKVD